MWGRAPLIADAGPWDVHLGTQQMEASLTPRGERNPSMDFAHTGSLMHLEVPVQRNFSRQHGPGKDRAPRPSDRSENRLVCPARIRGKRQQEGSLLVCRIRSELTTRVAVLPFRFLTFAEDISNELDRLEADIEQQASSAFPKRVKITQESVAEATGHDRTTFRGEYHAPLRLRLRELKGRAKDPKGVHLKVAAPTDVGQGKRKNSESPHPRATALLEENKALKLENRLLRRKQFEQRSGDSEVWAAFW
jgi:hypothetical protein